MVLNLWARFGPKINSTTFLSNISKAIRPAIHLAYFAFRGYFASVLAKHTMKYETFTIHFSYLIQISCLRKNKPRNPFNVLWECCSRALNGAKRKKMMRNVKKVTQNTSLYTSRFSHFTSISCYFASVKPALRSSSWSILLARSWLFTSNTHVNEEKLLFYTPCFIR